MSSLTGDTEGILAVRTTTASGEIEQSVKIDLDVTGSGERADYIRALAGRGGLTVAVSDGAVQAFCCVEDRQFFGRPFVGLLMVRETARRSGFGTALLNHVSSEHPEVWTSTNRSNRAMRNLLDTLGWLYCGELVGLDEGDPERFYKSR